MSRDGEGGTPSGSVQGGWLDDANKVMVAILVIRYFEKQWVEEIAKSAGVIVSELMGDAQNCGCHGGKSVVISSGNMQVCQAERKQ